MGTRNCGRMSCTKNNDDEDDDGLRGDFISDYFKVSSMKPAEAVAAWKGMVEKA